MSLRSAAANRTGPARVSRSTPRASASSAAMAYRGVLLTGVRQGTPQQVIQMLERLRADKDVELDDDAELSEIAAEDADLPSDADLDLRDEDDPNDEEWADDGPDQEEDAMSAASSSDRFTLIVQGATCRLSADGRFFYRPRTPLGQQVLYGLDIRLRTLSRTAQWLTDKRPQFLQSQNIWDLGCDALRELSDRRPSVIQQHFLRQLPEGENLSEASLSRYVRATQIVWPNGSGELSVLFSDSARRAWVANAVRQFLEARGEPVTPQILDEYASATAARSKNGRDRMLQRRVDRMDLPSLIATANMLAGTKWADVVSEYRNRLIG